LPGAYSQTGQRFIPPEYLLRTTLLQAVFTVCSEGQLMGQINYNLLFRWFVALLILGGWNAAEGVVLDEGLKDKRWECRIELWDNDCLDMAGQHRFQASGPLDSYKTDPVNSRVNV
jgi:Transposase domain (DUF772)